MFRRWITKHMCGFCGCNEHLSHYKEGVKNVCPACGARGESTAHITVYPDPERSSIYRSSVDEVVA